jgi:hypothetical protein
MWYAQRRRASERIEPQRRESLQSTLGGVREQQDGFQVHNALQLYTHKPGGYQERHQATPALQ